MMRKCFRSALFLTILFSGVVSGEPKPLTITQTRLGNLFLEGQPIVFRIEGPSESVAWTVKDFWGKVVLSGELPITNGVGELVLPLKSRGYFSLALSAGKTAYETSFSVLTPFDVKAVADSPFGMCTHFAQGYPPEVMDVVAMAGIKTIRDELYWDNVERKKGQYNFDAYWYMGYARKAGVRPLICLSYGNKLYDDKNAPVSKEGVQAFANYARAVVNTFGDFLEGVEVWNEYNCGFNTGKTGNKAETYLPLLQATYKTVKAARPQTRVVGVAMSCLIWNWLDQLLGLGALDYMDDLSVHPYRWFRWTESPETLSADMVKLNAAIKKHNKTGRIIPAWSTEVSWPSMPKWEVSPELQADYIVRTYAILWSRGVAKNYWYKLVCEVDDDLESQFGIMRHWTDPRGKLTPKPAYVALAVMARQLSGWTFVEREKTNAALWCLRFKKGSEEKRLLWAPQPFGVTITADKPTVVTDIMGNDQTLQPVKGEFCLTLSGSPVYLHGPVKAMRSGTKVFITTNPKIATGDPIVLKCTPHSDVTGVLDIEGTTYAIDGKVGLTTITLAGSKAPATRTIVYYLKVSGQLAAQGSLPVQIMDPLELKAAVVKKKDVLEFTFENHSVVRRLALTGVEWELAGKKGIVKLDRVLEPSSRQTVEFAIPELEPYQVVPAKVHFKFAGNDSFDFARDISFSPSVKRAGPEDIKSPFIDLATVGRVKIKDYRGEKDLAGRVWIGWDDANFYLTARIDDDRFYQEYPREELWEGDGIQFGLASDSDNCYEIGVALTSQGVRADCVSSPVATNPDTVISQSKFAVRKEGSAVIYQCSIPWAQLAPIKPQNGSFLFSFLVNDNDGSGRKGWIEWASGIGDYKCIDFYQTCRFVENLLFAGYSLAFNRSVL